MHRFVLFLLLSSISFSGFAQLNMTLTDYVPYPANLNDIWGWEAPDGTEYALVGAVNGVSIVSLAEPGNAAEVAWIPGQNSTWRDIKTWGSYAFVTTDQSGTTEGLLVIDLSDLPNSVSHFNWQPDLPGLGTLRTCHNLYIDEFGYCYLSGCNLNEGGMLILDVFSNPGTPLFVAAAPPVYAHDVYVRDNLMYASEIYAGQFGVYDVSDKSDIQFLASRKTPFEFTHNAWLSDDGTVLFTTDERANAPVGAYDVSDLTDIVELDQFRPVNTLGEGVIPHNVHVWNDFIIISYYTDGCIIVDAARPDNLIEVGNFDTYLTNDQGFNGAWGAYPFLPSGRVLVSDINSGLYVFDVDYVRACYLEGKVTNAQNGQSLFDVKVEILSAEPNISFSKLNGVYKTGVAVPGVFDVKFSKPGFFPKTIPTTLENGVISILDVELEPAPIFTGAVVRNAGGQPIENAHVRFISADEEVETLTDGSGQFQAPLLPQSYSVVAGAWGYEYNTVSLDIPASGPLTIALDAGYQDDFFFDYGWVADGDASAGFWEWVVPQQSVTGNQVSTPGYDIQDDLGDMCYVTGNGGNAGANDVDNGTVTLTSPPMDLSGYNEPVLSYYVFFFNGGGNGTPNDNMSVRIDNGIEEVELEYITQSGNDWRPQAVFHLNDYIAKTDNMRLIFETSDLPGSGHVVEAAVDAILVVDANPSSVDPSLIYTPTLEIGPNPFTGSASMRYYLGAESNDNRLELYDIYGRLAHSEKLAGPDGNAEIGGQLNPGAYIVVIYSAGKPVLRQKIVKVK
jgi:choice-of-anchor B domain-containing protein